MYGNENTIVGHFCFLAPDLESQAGYEFRDPDLIQVRNTASSTPVKLSSGHYLNIILKA
jgi:hypothetical protein